jgi:hypothetical protein
VLQVFDDSGNRRTNTNDFSRRSAASLTRQNGSVAGSNSSIGGGGRGGGSIGGSSAVKGAGSPVHHAKSPVSPVSAGSSDSVIAATTVPAARSGKGGISSFAGRNTNPVMVLDVVSRRPNVTVSTPAARSQGRSTGELLNTKYRPGDNAGGGSGNESGSSRGARGRDAGISGSGVGSSAGVRFGGVGSSSGGGGGGGRKRVVSGSGGARIGFTGGSSVNGGARTAGVGGRSGDIGGRNGSGIDANNHGFSASNERNRGSGGGEGSGGSTSGFRSTFDFEAPRHLSLTMGGSGRISPKKNRRCISPERYVLFLRMK